MRRNQGKKIVAGLLAIFISCFVASAHAGLFGAIVGEVIEHHVEQQQANDGHQTALTDHPVAGAVAGTVAGSAAEGLVVHEARAHPMLALAGGALAAASADDVGRDYLEKHECSSENPPYWSCPGIPGQHVLPVEAKDLYIQARTEKLQKNLAKAGEPKPGKGCAAHHIVMKEDGKFPASEESRRLLERCSIDLDSAENGVWLPDTQNGSACQGAYHRTLHTQSYSIKVYRKLLSGFIKNKCGGVRNALEDIKQELKNGK